MNWSFDCFKINVQTLVMTGHLDKMFGIPKDIEELVKKNTKLNHIRITQLWSFNPTKRTRTIF